MTSRFENVAAPDHSDLWRLEQLALVSQVATQVTHILDLEELFVRVVGLIYQTFEFYVVSLYTLEGESLVMRAQAGPATTFRVEDAFVPQAQVGLPLGQGVIGWVAKHQQELVVRDVSQETRFSYAPEWPNTQAEVALPLKVESRILGVLDVQLDYPEDFDEADMLVLRALAGQVSMAIEDTRLYAEAKRRGDHLAMIGAVSEAIISILEVDQVLGEVGRLIQRYFNYPSVQLFTINYGQRRVEFKAGSGPMIEALITKPPQTYHLDDLQNLIAGVARTGQASRVDRAAILVEPASPPLVQSELIVPLIYNEQVLGVLAVQSDKPNAFTENDQLTMETLAANIAIALRNAKLYDSERWRYRVAESLRRISGALISEVDLGTILDSILIELQGNLPIDVSAIWLIRTRKLRLVALQPPDPIAFIADFEPEQDEWLAKGLADTATEPVLRHEDEAPDPIAAFLGYEPNHSAIVAPLRVQHRLLGVLTLVNRQPGRYGQEAKQVTTAFAHQAAIAIENARLFRLAQEEVQINNALLRVADMTQGFSELSAVIEAIVQIPPLLTDVRQCAIWLWHSATGAFEPEKAFGFNSQALAFFEQYPLHQAEVVAVERLVQIKAPMVITEASEDARLPAELVENLGVKTLVLLPIIAHRQVLGLMLVTFSRPEAMRQESIDLITGVAHQAAAAIESKYLYAQKAEQERLAHEMRLAHTIQASLIPTSLPASPGWQVAALWESIQAVGGDFYDFIEVGTHLLGIVIADVSGKGLPAALYMIQSRALLRATAPGQTDPGQVLARTNQLLVPDTRQGIFVSLFYAILDTDSGLLRYANGGHNPPLLMQADGESEPLRLPGMVLGIDPTFTPQVGQRQLHSGEGVVFYTDGVTEVHNTQDELFGEARLRQILRQAWPHGPKAVVTAVQEAVNAFSATEMPTDDITLLVLRRE